jgi:hypothetical protein
MPALAASGLQDVIRTVFRADLPDQTADRSWRLPPTSSTALG